MKNYKLLGLVGIVALSTSSVFAIGAKGELMKSTKPVERIEKGREISPRGVTLPESRMTTGGGQVGVKESSEQTAPTSILNSCRPKTAATDLNLTAITDAGAVVQTQAAFMSPNFQSPIVAEAIPAMSALIKGDALAVEGGLQLFTILNAKGMELAVKDAEGLAAFVEGQKTGVMSAKAEAFRTLAWNATMEELVERGYDKDLVQDVNSCKTSYGI